MYQFDAVYFRVNDVTETVTQGLLQTALYLAVLGAAERAGLVSVRRSMRTTMSTRVRRVTVATAAAAAVTGATVTAAGAAVVTAAAAGVAAAVTSTAVSAVAAATLVVMVTLSGSTRAAKIQLEPNEHSAYIGTCTWVNAMTR